MLVAGKPFSVQYNANYMSVVCSGRLLAERLARDKLLLDIITLITLDQY